MTIRFRLASAMAIWQPSAMAQALSAKLMIQASLLRGRGPRGNICCLLYTSPAYEILEKYKGTDLERREYEPLFACTGEAAAKQHKKAHFVTCDNYVTMSDGTGIVHIAPAFGEDDSRVGREYDLPFVQFVDGQGNMTKETPYAGVFVKKAVSYTHLDVYKRQNWSCLQ